MPSNEDTQQFSAAEVAQLKSYVKRSRPINNQAQSQQPQTNRVHVAIVVVVGIVSLAILALIAWYLFLSSALGGQPSYGVTTSQNLPGISSQVLEQSRY